MIEMSYTTLSLKKIMYQVDEIQAICESNARDLKTPLNGVALLKTISILESNFAQDCRPRFKPAYYPGGIYFKKSKQLQDAYEQWGGLIAWSYGPFQIMFCNAMEHGYPKISSPLDLWSGYVSGPYVVSYLNEANQKGVKSIESTLAAYNGGLGAITRPNDRTKKYVAQGVAIYKKLI